MRTVKKVITIIVAFILTISLVACFFVNLLSSKILNEKYVLSKLEETNYYEQVYELVQSNFENYIQQSGLDEDVIENIITEEKIKEDTEQILTNIYDGLNEEITTQDIEDNLRANIEESLSDIVLTEDEEDAIDVFIQKICSEYENTILHTSYEEDINNMFQQISDLTKSAKQVLFVAIGLSIILLILVNIRNIYRGIRGISISLISTGVIFLIVKFYINSKIKVQLITVLNEAFSVAVRNIFSEILQNLLIYGIVLVLIGVIVIILSNLIHNIRKYGIEKK